MAKGSIFSTHITAGICSQRARGSGRRTGSREASAKVRARAEVRRAGHILPWHKSHASGDRTAPAISTVSSDLRYAGLYVLRGASIAACTAPMGVGREPGVWTDPVEPVGVTSVRSPLPRQQQQQQLKLAVARCPSQNGSWTVTAEATLPSAVRHPTSPPD